MRRGVTIVELLAALALLAAIAAALTTWVRTTAVTTAQHAGPARWHQAAEAMLRHVQDDMVTGDLGHQGEDERLTWRNGTLEIHTRGRAAGGPVGAVVHRYVLARGDAELRLETRGNRSRPPARLLLDDVAAWRCAIDEENAILTVEIESTLGATLERTYRYR